MQPEETSSRAPTAPGDPPPATNGDTEPGAKAEPKISLTDRIRGAVRRIARDMRETKDRPNPPISRGDRAALRRMHDGRPDGMVFWKLASRYLEDQDLLLHRHDQRRHAVERAWAAVFATAARLEGKHRGNHHLGRAMAEAEVSEARFQRLYAARGEALLDALRGVVHQLDSAGTQVDLGDVAELLLSDGSEREHDGVLWEDDVRHKLALDFYRHQKKTDSNG